MIRVIRTAVSALVVAAGLTVLPGAAQAAEPWTPGTIVVFPGNETARVDNNGQTVTFDLGSSQPWGPQLSVDDAASLGAVKATRL